MGWRYVAASVRGTSHDEQDIPCQDASLVLPLPNDSLLIVASDGAGSAKYSHQGSHLACDIIAEAATEHIASGGTVVSLTQSEVDAWIDKAVHALHVQAAAIGEPVRELACTLLVALLSDDGNAYFQLGDGAIVAGDGGSYAPVTWPSGGEYANTTFFLSDDRALEQFQFIFAAPPTTDVALLTDGLQMLALQFDTRSAYAPFFRSVFAPLHQPQAPSEAWLQQALGEYLNSPAINRRTDDDKTLVLASRAGPLKANGAVAPDSAQVPAV